MSMWRLKPVRDAGEEKQNHDADILETRILLISGHFPLADPTLECPAFRRLCRTIVVERRLFTIFGLMAYQLVYKTHRRRNFLILVCIVSVHDMMTAAQTHAGAVL